MGFKLNNVSVGYHLLSADTSKTLTQWDSSFVYGCCNRGRNLHSHKSNLRLIIINAISLSLIIRIKSRSRSARYKEMRFPELFHMAKAVRKKSRVFCQNDIGLPLLYEAAGNTKKWLLKQNADVIWIYTSIIPKAVQPFILWPQKP